MKIYYIEQYQTLAILRQWGLEELGIDSEITLAENGNWLVHEPKGLGDE